MTYLLIGFYLIVAFILFCISLIVFAVALGYLLYQPYSYDAKNANRGESYRRDAKKNLANAQRYVRITTHFLWQSWLWPWLAFKLGRYLIREIKSAWD